jgi:predicted GNAT family acetyltransferase
MRVRTHDDARSFLQSTRLALEAQEAANSLMLGICGQLIRHPERIKEPSCLKTVEGEGGLILAAIMTPPHKLVVYGHQGDLDGGTRMLLEDMALEGWQLPGVFGPREIARHVAERWAEIGGRGFDLEQRLRVYEAREVVGPRPERGRLRRAGATDIELVGGWRHAFHMEIYGHADAEEVRRGTRSRIEAGDVYLWEDGEPVSMAMKTRPTGKGISVTLVYTPPRWRGKGYATACVGELTRMLLAEGWEFCALFADLANAASNHLYRKLGYKAVCDYDEYAFGDGSWGS